MLATSTHDTKRSEDVRARLHLLSQLPEAWADAVGRWSALNERHRTDGLPDRNTEWFLYQTLVGAWPIAADRLQAAMVKSVREAKLHTSWTARDQAYEAALARFIDRICGDLAFQAELASFVGPLERPAQVTSLAMALLKLTSPGVPDIYQGTELWQRSLVDPDNRRPVDFELRARLLDEMQRLGPEDVMARLAEGLPKLWTVARTLAVRGEHADCFGAAGGYEPLRFAGPRARNAIGFVRGGRIASIVPRLVLDIEPDGWGDSVVELPAGRWRNALTDEPEFAGGSVRLGRLLALFPVALLVRGS